MAIDLQPLVDRFYDYFLDLYHKQSDAEVSGAHADTPKAGEPFLAFGGIGAALTPEMFTLQDGSGSTALVTEQFSGLANLLPDLDGTTITSPGLLSADGAYGALLAQAQPLTATDMQALGAIRDPAERAFAEAAEAPLIRGGVEYRPALPLPPDWPLPSGEGAWTSYSTRTEEKTTVTAPPPPAGTIRPRVDWRWRVAPPALRETVKALGAVATTVAPRPAPVPTAAMQARIAVLRTPVSLAPRVSATATPMARMQMARPMAGAVLGQRPTLVKTAPMRPPPVIAEVVQSKVLLQQLQTVREESQPQAVTSASMELSFRYCLVTARRPWVSSAFLTARNWFIPRMRAGEIASGTGLGEGSFECMPTAALCVRDLRITAAWSDEERAVLPAITKFGPFSLVGSQLEANATSLLCPGIQVIGWVMEPMPMLPPNSDPALPAA
ncbi:hypothetical protein ACFQS7_06515 [Dankookia sp. GCM10030260]|uniref:hypothetical protein n=1 Tax=Dankookia sp. GCM10030260 TaxID=3273390 RepID=UPI00362323E0